MVRKEFLRVEVFRRVEKEVRFFREVKKDFKLSIFRI